MSVAVPAGFKASGVAAGIKAAGALDVALVVADPDSIGSAVFTVNSAAAAPVRLSRKHLAMTSSIRAIVINSGGANAATGERGDAAAAAMAERVAAAVGCDTSQVLVCSTGTIGSQLPLDIVLGGIDAAAASLAPGSDASMRAAQAIMTTDSVSKEASYTSGAGWSVGGAAKGAGMIRPDLATMLAILTSDATVSQATLESALRAGVDSSFHELNVDGCPSTNDTVALIASGASRVEADPAEFTAGVKAVCRDLAEQIAADAEGASRVVVIHVRGTESDSQARHYGRSIADSALVRAAFFGGDPNWGRIIGALGVVAPPDVVARADIDFAGVAVARAGVSVECDEDSLAAELTSGNFTVKVCLGDGSGEAHILTTDLTPDYVHFNGERS